MVFHWSLRDSMFSLVSRTVLSILVDLNNAVFWMVLRCPLIFKYSMSFKQSFDDCTERSNYNWYLYYFFVPSYFFISPAKSKQVSLFSISFSFTLWSAGTAKFPIRQVLFFFLFSFFFFFFYYHRVWSPGQDRLRDQFYLKIPNKFERLILSDAFGFMNIPFIHMVKFKILAQLSILLLAILLSLVMTNFII